MKFVGEMGGAGFLRRWHGRCFDRRSRPLSLSKPASCAFGAEIPR